MTRFLAMFIALSLCIVCTGARAQAPQITVSAEQGEVLVGQPFVLSLEVLVPTFMPKAPVFPTFEMPGLIVRLPERSTAPVSRQIEGATWAGVRRTYRIYPMRAGTTEIPAQKLSIVYKNTDKNEDVPLTVDVPATQILARVPPGARTLDPLIVAQGLSIDQSWQVAKGSLAVGDAVVRQLEISVQGTSALFVPPLLDGAAPMNAQGEVSGSVDTAVAGFLPYPEDARVTETMDRNVMSGTRTEIVSYIAQTGGVATFPQIVLRWFNLDTQEIEEIVLDGRNVTVEMPPRVRTALDRQKSRKAALILSMLVALGWAACHWLWPVVRPRLGSVRDAYGRSAFAAHRIAERRAADGDLGGLLLALEDRATRGHPPSKTLRAAVEALTRSVYRDGKAVSEAQNQWRDVRQQLRKDRLLLLGVKRDGNRSELAQLNPFS